ncbi:MAG: ABC transporter permease [Actinomycetota bacterium]|nr:ABC transporter permease [Actinomycetota bacterium]
MSGETKMNRDSGGAGEPEGGKLHLNRTRIVNLLLRNLMALVVIAVAVYFSIARPQFATLPNMRTILIAAAPFALIALGQTLVILTGGIDLSVGSIVALSAMTGAAIVVGHPERMLLASAVAILAGLLAGLISGLVVAYVNVPPFVTTLGMLSIASGLAYAIGNGAPINGLPLEWGQIANTRVLTLQAPVLVMIAGFLILGIVMARTSFGMRIYAVGGNRTAAEVAGVKSRRILTSVYAISGALAGMSGLILSSRVISAAPYLGKGYELGAIAAVVIGGASLQGGRGTVWGTLLGLLLIQTLNNGLDILVVPAYWQTVISGLLIVSAVAVDMVASKRSYQ